jgi:hypothetical protein
MNLHREFVQNRRHKGIAGKPKTAGEEVANTMTSSASGAGTYSSRGARPSPAGKNPAASYSLIKLVVTLDSPKTKDGWSDFECFTAMSSLGSASTSPISSPSDLISPSSRFSDPLAAGIGLSSRS